MCYYFHVPVFHSLGPADPVPSPVLLPSQQSSVPWEGVGLGVEAAVPAVLAGFLLRILEAPIASVPCAPAGCSLCSRTRCGAGGEQGL